MDKKNSVNELYKLNPKLSTPKKKCIFGTGMHARQTYVDLSAQGVKIDYFVDREVSGSKASYMGIPLISEEELKGLGASVVIASTAWEDISKRLIQQGITDLFVDLHRYGEVDVQDGYLCAVGKYGMKRDTLYILCPAGIGDTLYAAAFARAAMEYRGDMERVCLITKASHACIGDFFEGVDEVIASDQLAEQLDFYSIAAKTWYLKNYIYGHFKKNLCQTFDDEYRANKNLPILSYYKKIILRIPDESKLDSFHYEFKDTDQRQIPKTVGGNKRFVILMPYANTAKMLSMEFWEKCVDLFINDGYCVYTNVKDAAEQAISGTAPICENIYDMVGICKQAELTISVRNGMCDVLAMSKAPLMILDTDKEFYEKWDTKLLNPDAIHIRCFEAGPEDIWREVLYQCKRFR